MATMSLDQIAQQYASIEHWSEENVRRDMQIGTFCSTCQRVHTEEEVQEILTKMVVYRLTGILREGT